MNILTRLYTGLLSLRLHLQLIIIIIIIIFIYLLLLCIIKSRQTREMKYNTKRIAEVQKK